MEKNIHHLQSKINYSFTGNGEKILVLLHGFCEDLNVWNEFIVPLEKDIRIICIDLPGFGKSLPGTEHTTLEHIADAIEAVLISEQIEKCFMVGHSMGGYVALAFAEKYSDRLCGIGLFHSSCFQDDDQKKQNRKKVAEFVLSNGSKVFAHELFPTLFTNEFAANNKLLIQSLEDRAAVFPASAIANGSLAMGNRKDKTSFLSTTSLPILMIIGKHDLAIPFEKSLMMSHLPASAQICLLQHSAHMGMFEEPEKSKQAVLNFVLS
ncbi:MAG TPA: alpha/beta hydrolase [Bacteroidetes bacterium]|nr:alpha/beta hydrolase [Bacteroidota bacterium]